jgi:hypothetical protein
MAGLNGYFSVHSIGFWHERQSVQNVVSGLTYNGKLLKEIKNNLLGRDFISSHFNYFI